MRGQVTGNSHFVLTRLGSEALGPSMTHGLHGRRVVDLDELLGEASAVFESVESLVFFREEADDTVVRWLESPTLTGVIKTWRKRLRERERERERCEQ